MTGLPGKPSDASRFSPEAFFARATRRLDRRPATAAIAGDHVLNPDFASDEATYHEAAILMPVVARRPGVGMLLTQRTSHLSAHAGQIAFPGGRVDAADAGPAAAALREAHEEIGLDPAAVEVIGYLGPYLTRTGYRVTPVLGRIEPGHQFVLNRDEVEDLFEVPMAFLMTPANIRRASRVIMGRERFFYELDFDGRRIWGVTAGIIRALHERMFA